MSFRRRCHTERRVGARLVSSLLNKAANKAVDHLPFELHLPGYQYCGPGTRLERRLERGDRGINPLDAGCKQHDIAYTSGSTNSRRDADKMLASKAWQRVTARDASVGERAAALAVTALMKGKARLGAGRLRRTKRKGKRQTALHALRRAVAKARQALPKRSTGLRLEEAVKRALSAARGVRQGRWFANALPRVHSIAVRSGGFLPLVPLFAGLSALGAITGGAAGVASAITKAQAAKGDLTEAQRHNRMMEAVALQGGSELRQTKRKGLGLYLRPWRADDDDRR